MTSPNDIGARLSLRGRAQFSRDAAAAAQDLGRIGNAAVGAENLSRKPLNAIGQGVMGVGKMAVLGVGLGVSALGALGGAAIGMGISTASANQQASISFTTMLGSGEKAAAFLKDLQGFAATTPFEFPELQTAASSLISAGFAAGDVIPIMTSLGNATSGMGTGAEGVQRATIALQQMSAAGRITGEDLNQLRDAGIPVFDLLAAATGKTKAQIADLASKGKLGKKEMEALFTALKSGKGLERFNGLMEKQSKSLAGSFSTLKDNVNMGLATALAPAIPMLTELTVKAGDLVAKGVPAFSAFVSNAITEMPKLFAAIKGGDTKSISQVLDGILGGGGDFAGPIQTALDGIISVVDRASKVISESLIPVIHSVASAIDPAWLTPMGAANALLSLMADHTDGTRVALYVLVGALVAARVAGFAFLAYQRASAAWTFIQTARTYGLSYAVKAGGVAELVLNGIRRAGLIIGRMMYALQLRMILQNIRATATLVAQSIATRVVSAATRAYAAAQWLVNAALTANPIGIVIVSLVLLGAAFVVLWKKSQTFRTIVTAAFREVAQAGLWMVEQVLGYLATLLNGLGHLPGKLGAPFRTAGAAVQDMKNKVTDLRTGLDSLGKGVTIPVHAVNDVRASGAAGVAARQAVNAKLERLHDGGTLTSAGAVNMKPGEEVVVLPQAASVVPMGRDLSDVADAVSNGGSRGTGTIHLQVTLDRKVLAEAVYQHTGDKVARR